MEEAIENVKSCAVRHCGSFEVDRHHIKQRSAGGSDSVNNIVYLCRRHHDWAHSKIYYAHDLGLICFDYEDEPTQPLVDVEIRPIKKKPERPNVSDIDELDSKLNG